MSDEAMRAATGRDREGWLALLDGGDAPERSHGEIGAWLAAEHGVDGWWTQTITVEFERAPGLRPPRGGHDGLFTVNVSKTVPVPVERLYAAVVDPGLREGWLPGGALRERTARPSRSARFDWQGGPTRVIVGFARRERPGARSPSPTSACRTPRPRTGCGRSGASGWPRSRPSWRTGAASRRPPASRSRA